MDYIEMLKTNARICRPLRTYFDSGSYQYNQTELLEKCYAFGRILYFNYDLRRLISEYKNMYAYEGCEHIYNNVSNTLVELITFIETGSASDLEIMSRSENKTETSIVDELIDLIKTRLLPCFSLERLILSYTEWQYTGKNPEFLKQSEFFNVNLEKNMFDILKRRQAEENIEDRQWGYTPLYQYLKHVVYANVHANQVSDLNPKWGMPLTKGLIYLINKNYPCSIQPRLATDEEYRKQRIIAFAKELIEIIYFNKPVRKITDDISEP